jgi:hypothetical protein
MQLERLEIRRNEYGHNKGKMEGEITFKNPVGKIQLILTDDACKKILEFCAEGLVDSAKEVASRLTAEIITSTPLLENN